MSTTKKTRTETSTETRKKQSGRRLQQLPADAGQKLSSLEENVLRMYHGLAGVDKIETVTMSDELAEKLHAIEARAFEMTGRADKMRNRADSPKDKIISRLKDKA